MFYHKILFSACREEEAKYRPASAEEPVFFEKTGSSFTTGEFRRKHEFGRDSRRLEDAGSLYHLRKKLDMKNQTLAGRSARRRMK